MASSSSARVGDVRRESRATVQGKDEVGKTEISEYCGWRKKKRYTFGRSSTASFESVREARRCEEATIWRNWKERAKPNFEFIVFFFFSLFFPLHLPDAARPSALRATWPHCCSERALQTTCARSSSAYRPCFRFRKPRLVGRCSRARPRDAHCTGEPGGPRLRTPPWPRRGDQSRRRAIWGPFSHVLV